MVTVGGGGRLQRGEVRTAGPLRQHLRGLAGELTGGEELPHPVADVGRRELVGQSDDHVATGAERAHHADLGLVEQVGPGRPHRRRVDPGLPCLVAERRGREVVLDQVTPRCLERRRHHHRADVPAPTVVLLQPGRMAVGLLGAGGDRATHQGAERLEVGSRPGQPVGAQVPAHEALQGRIRRPPVAADSTHVALGGVAAGLGLAGERKVVDRLAEVGGHGRMLGAPPAGDEASHRPM